jgi:hypothetical protein
MEMPDRNGASADDPTTQQNMDAFLSGCAAHANGAAFTACPFGHGTAEQDSWHRGYRLSRLKALPSDQAASDQAASGRAASD